MPLNRDLNRIAIGICPSLAIRPYVACCYIPPLKLDSNCKTHTFNSPSRRKSEVPAEHRENNDRAASHMTINYLINYGNKITFKQTLSLSNAVCLKHDNNVCAFAVSTLILLPIVNLSPEMDSATSISYTCRRQFCRSTLLFVYFGDFSLRMRSFDHITTSS